MIRCMLIRSQQLIRDLGAVYRATQFGGDLVYNNFNRIALRKSRANLVGNAIGNRLDELAGMFHHVGTDLVDDLVIDREMQVIVDGRSIDIRFDIDIDNVIVTTRLFVRVITMVGVKGKTLESD